MHSTTDAQSAIRDGRPHFEGAQCARPVLSGRTHRFEGAQRVRDQTDMNVQMSVRFVEHCNLRRTLTAKDGCTKYVLKLLFKTTYSKYKIVPNHISTENMHEIGAP